MQSDAGISAQPVRVSENSLRLQKKSLDGFCSHVKEVRDVRCNAASLWCREFITQVGCWCLLGVRGASDEGRFTDCLRGGWLLGRVRVDIHICDLTLIVNNGIPY